MFKLPDEVKKGIESYKSALGDLLTGKLAPARFKGIRVPWGIYSQRGEKVYMARVRIPAGLVNAAQLKALASAAEKFAQGKLHITTRQDIQIHDLKIEDTAKVMDYLKEYNLSARGGGGNTVRNVIACVLSGICKDETFDVRSDAIALSEYILRQEASFNLPRKFKISFSGCRKDCAGCLVNDVGFLAKLENGKKGFKVFTGGGMGAESRLGKLLEEFIPQEDLGYCTEAIKNVFYKNGDRRNKHHNRLRFLIEDLGFEKFKELYRKELKDLKENAYIALRKMEASGDTFLKRSIAVGAGEIPQIEDAEYSEFLKYNVQPQKQKGFSALELRIGRGNISAEDLWALADLEHEFGEIEFRTSQNQNLFICWVKQQDIYKLFLKVKGILPDFLYPETILDIVACKGALTCNLGLCNSPGLSKEIEKVIKENFIGKKVFEKLEIKINGCPNSCGQHPIGKISFYGMVKRVDNRPVPFYRLLLGGRKEAELTKFAEGIGVIPARNIPVFLKEFLEQLEKKITGEEDIYEFLQGPAKDIAQEVLGKFSYVPAFSENKDFYVDWGKQEEFSLAGLGPGECGAGVLDMIDSDLADAKLALEGAEKENYSIQQVKKAIFFSSRSLLVVKGVEPKTELEALAEFKKKFVETGIADSRYGDLEDVFKSIRDDLNAEERKEKFLYAKDFFTHINELYKAMDSSFNFPQRQAEAEKLAIAQNTLNLKGVACPINYVKTKLFLEGLKSGDTLEVFLDEGEPIDNVPKSLQNDGHQILKIERLNGFYRIVVKKA